ncbi:hypothetical protein ACHAXT_000603 [Thalassiosira profunda]
MFPGVDNQQQEDNEATMDERRRVRWRYQLRWRTPQRLVKTLQSWSNYFFTGHGPLLFAMDDRKRQPIRFDEFSTEGAYTREHSGVKSNSDADDLIPHADQIAESLSLIFRDRDAALRNATQSRAIKHQESYDTKTLDDVLGVAVQQTFDVGISYDFDHFDSPEEGEEASIHQLRARLAKSAVRRKRELDGAVKNELQVLRRLKDNVVTAANREVAETEMELTEQGIRERRDREVNHMRNALLTLIPTNADDLPKGTERYDNPMMVSEYVNLTAPFQPAGELTATVGDAPDPLAALEDYVRRDFGDEAADAYRQDELAARKKEQDLLTNFRSQYGELDDDEAVDTR